MTPELLDIPIYPLPNVTFFAQTHLPLSIVEPRYKKMIDNCLAGDRLLGIALLKDGWQRDYFGRPPIFRTFGVGKIVDCEELDDGRYHARVEGRWRVRLVEEFPTHPFRAGRVDVLFDPPIDMLYAEVSAMMKELREMTGRIAACDPEQRPAIQSAWAAHPHPLVTINHLADALVIDSYERQSILEQDDPLRRIRLVAIQMRRLLAQVDGSAVRNHADGDE